MDELISKSQKKRDADALQRVGNELVALSLDKLDDLPLSPPLKNAILEAKLLKSHGAVKRQSQLIGKLMRADDFEAILAAYADILADGSAKTASFHEVEHWRTRLIEGGRQALTEFVDAHRPTDVQHLRQLIKKAIDEQAKELHTGAGKALFRYLRPYFQ